MGERRQKCLFPSTSYSYSYSFSSSSSSSGASSFSLSSCCFLFFDLRTPFFVGGGGERESDDVIWDKGKEKRRGDRQGTNPFFLDLMVLGAFVSVNSSPIFRTYF